MRYRHYKDELLEIMKYDQQDIRAYAQEYKRSPTSLATLHNRERLEVGCLKRAKRMLEILDSIGTLTLENIGVDGSEAMTVIALHSKYSVMRQVLAAYEAALQADRTNVFLEGIPSLTDRALIVERKKQRFATQWWFKAGGSHYLYPVEDFAHLNKRRAAYGLGVARHPRILTYGIPKGPLPPKTQESDQRQPSPEEYEDQISSALD